MNRLLIKETAVIGPRHFDAVMVPMWIAFLEKSPKMTDNLVVVTCGLDSHEVGLHPYGRALDVRTRNIEAPSLEVRREIARLWAKQVRSRLGSRYDVLFEQSAINSNNDHLHGEYDPRGNT